MSKAFHYPIRSRVSRLLRVELRTQRDAYWGVQRSSGPLKQHAGKQVSKLDQPKCVFLTNRLLLHGLRGQNECHLSMFVLGNISTAFLALSVDGNISIDDKK